MTLSRTLKVTIALASMGALVGTWVWWRQETDNENKGNKGNYRQIARRPSETARSTPFAIVPRRFPPVQKTRQSSCFPTAFILCYHDITPRVSPFALSPRQFEAHLRMLKAHGFAFLTVSELVDLLDGERNGAVPRRVVAISIDDGFRSAYTVVFPLLRKYQAKATLFIYTRWVGETESALTWAQLKEMAQSGLVEIASHSVTHAYPDKLRRTLGPTAYRQRWLWELQASKEALERHLGITVRGVAYPGGQVDETLKLLAKQVGYEWAVVINPKPVAPSCDRYALPRFGMNRTVSLSQVLGWLLRAPKTSRSAQRLARLTPSPSPHEMHRRPQQP